MEKKFSLRNLSSGYIGTPERWVQFFEIFLQSKYIEKEMVQFDDVDWNNLKSEILKILKMSLSKEKKIFEIEEKLNLKLPKSYHDFILANGVEVYNAISFLFFAYTDFFDINKIDFFIKKNKGVFKRTIGNLRFNNDVANVYYSYNNYKEKLYSYNGEFNPRISSFNLSTALGELGTGFIEQKRDNYAKAIVLDSNEYPSFLLLPNERTQDDEMEAWLLEASDIYRYRSFAEMIVNNMFIGLEIPENMTVKEYLVYHGVDKILDFDILEGDAYVDI